MLVPLSRVSTALPCTLMRNVFPALTNMPATLFRARRPEVQSPFSSTDTRAISSSAKGSFTIQKHTGFGSAEARAFSLFGMTNTDRLVGAAAMRQLMQRNISVFSREKANAGPMIEPYGSVISSLEPDLQKIGFKKIRDNRFSMAFSDGINKLELVCERYFHSSLIDKNGDHHCLWVMMEKLNSRETTKLNKLEHNALLAKYRFMADDLPEDLRNEGYAAYLLLDLKHTIQFLETHKDALAQLTSDTDCDHNFSYRQNNRINDDPSSAAPNDDHCQQRCIRVWADAGTLWISDQINGAGISESRF